MLQQAVNRQIHHHHQQKQEEQEQQPTKLPCASNFSIMYIYNFNDNMNGIPLVNVEMATPSQLPPSSAVAATVTNTSNLSVGTISTAGATPLTPEILNSVMAMTNPLEYTFPSSAGTLMTTKISQV